MSDGMGDVEAYERAYAELSPRERFAVVHGQIGQELVRLQAEPAARFAEAMRPYVLRELGILLDVAMQADSGAVT